MTNCNGKIWLVWNGDIDRDGRDEYEQQITYDFKHKE